MEDIVQVNAIYKISDNVISKNIEGQYMIVPLISDVGNLNEEMFQLNPTGSAIWELLDGKTSLIDIITHLSKEYDTPDETIKRDVINLFEKLIERAFVFKVA